MQEQDDIFIAKFKSGRVVAKPSTPARETTPPSQIRERDQTKSRRCLDWVRRLIGFRLCAKQDLNLEKFLSLETKRTRHQMERNRIHRYF